MSRVVNYPYFPLFLSASSTDQEGLLSLMFLTNKKIGRNFSAKSNLKTRSTTLFFDRADDRDAARAWALQWAAQSGLDAASIV